MCQAFIDFFPDNPKISDIYIETAKEDGDLNCIHRVPLYKILSTLWQTFLKIRYRRYGRRELSFPTTILLFGEKTIVAHGLTETNTAIVKVIGAGRLTTSLSSPMVEVTIYPTYALFSGRTMHLARKSIGLVRLHPQAQRM